MACLSVDVCVCLSVSLSVWSECLCVCVSATHKRSAGAALAGTTWSPVPSPALVVDHSQSPCPRSYPWYVSGYPKPLGHGWARPSLAKSKFGQVWLPSLAKPSLAKIKFGQTKFGQDQVWLDQVWPRPSLAKTKFGQDQVWPDQVAGQSI